VLVLINISTVKTILKFEYYILRGSKKLVANFKSSILYIVIHFILQHAVTILYNFNLCAYINEFQ